MRDLLMNPKAREVLKNIGFGLLLIIGIITVIAWIGVPVWFKTHHVHHSAFTWYLIWMAYAGTTAFLFMILMALGDS